MTVTDDIRFAERSLNERLVTQSEGDVLRILGVNVDTIDVKHEEEFHSIAYKRSKKSCSSIVQFCRSAQNKYYYLSCCFMYKKVDYLWVEVRKQRWTIDQT